MWYVEDDCAIKYKSELHKHRIDLLYELFGEHLHWQNNLTSDTEGEVMLTVSANTVCAYKENIDKYLPSAYSDYDKGFWIEQKAVFDDLFGSKCLPDEKVSDSTPLAEPKPQPKFHKGDRVKVIIDGYCKDAALIITDVNEVYPQFSYKLNCHPDVWFAESTLELVKESKPADDDDFKVPEPNCKHFKDGKCAHPAVSHIENGKLVKGADCDVSSCEDVEYEPKFKVGDTVRFKYCCTPHRINGLFKMSNSEMLYLVGKVWAKESELEPYTKPTIFNIESKDADILYYALLQLEKDN